MCAYNHEKYIAQAIEGVIKQKTNFKYRLFIGEDASTDQTKKIILEYSLKYPEIVFPIFQDSNIGASENTRILFSKCTSKYIALCDGDDYWDDETKLQKQVDFLESNANFSMCFHNVLIKREYSSSNDNKVDKFNGLMPKDEFVFEDVLDNWIAHTSSLVFKRTALLPLPDWFFNCFTGDLVIIILLASKGKLKYLDFVGSVYRLNDRGISVNYKEKYLMEGKIQLYKLLNQHFNFSYKKTLNKFQSKYYLKLSIVNFRNFEVGNFLYNSTKSLVLSPYVFVKQFIIEFKYYVNLAKAKV